MPRRLAGWMDGWIASLSVIHAGLPACLLLDWLNVWMNGVCRLTGFAVSWLFHFQEQPEAVFFILYSLSCLL